MYVHCRKHYGRHGRQKDGSRNGEAPCKCHNGRQMAEEEEEEEDVGTLGYTEMRFLKQEEGERRRDVI